MEATTAQWEAVADDDVTDAAHYAKYSFAAYGYLLYMLSSPIYMCAALPPPPPAPTSPPKCRF